MTKIKQIYITGSYGFIGDALTHAFEEDNRFEVYCDLPNSDIRNDSYLERIKKFNPDVIVHTAAIMGTDPVDSVGRQVAYEVNVDSCRRLSKLANELNSKLVYCASTASYKPTDDLIDETSDIDAVTFYGLTKHLGEREIVENCDDFLSLRLAMCYGPRLTYSFIPRIITAAKNSRWCTIHLDPNKYKDVMYYTDMTRAFLTAISSDINGIYNVSRMDPHLLQEIIDYLHGKNVCPLMYIEPTRDYMGNHVVSSSKFRNKTGWLPSVSLQEGIDDCIKKIIC